MNLLCFSHLRWDFVYQRPQHLISRFAVNKNVFYIEEPLPTDNDPFYSMRQDEQHQNIWIVNLYFSTGASPEKRIAQEERVLQTFMRNEVTGSYIAWYYTPMALQFSADLDPVFTVYDCMDELAAFKFAPPELHGLEQELFERADLVFVGGATLFQSKKKQHSKIFLFPSSIDRQHFSKARLPHADPDDQKSIGHPRLGFYGVLDERFHTSLIREAARLRPDWHFIFLGPVAKISVDALPTGRNIHYLGSKTYAALPVYLAGWDIALIPFELNESTRFISPTKTPEYLAGGKPVISTSIRDVVTPYATKGLVHIADTAQELVAQAEKVLRLEDQSEWLSAVDDFLSYLSWDETWKRMNELIEEGVAEKKTQSEKRISYV